MPKIFLPTIPTGISEPEAYKLAELAENRMVLELGSWYGFSATVMSQTAKQIVTIDHHFGEWKSEETLPIYTANTRMLKNVISIIGDNKDILWRLREDTFDMVFIDSAHDYESVKREAEQAFWIASKIIAFHDYGRGGEQVGVTQAVDEFCKDNNYELNLVDTLAWIEK